jgi:2-(3-amino-3-carboxypropyl)histidine synthase
LGCTSPSLHAHETSGYQESDAIVSFVADGRFHLESTLISNPHIRTFYRYDPYGKSLTEEEYAHEEMKGLRQKAVLAGGTASAKTFGILMGTLGRQGNPAIVQRIQKALRDAGKRHFLVLLSEISPAKLALLNANNNVDCWVQVACPRLSVDWGHFLPNPCCHRTTSFVRWNRRPGATCTPWIITRTRGDPGVTITRTTRIGN